MTSGIARNLYWELVRECVLVKRLENRSVVDKVVKLSGCFRSPSIVGVGTVLVECCQLSVHCKRLQQCDYIPIEVPHTSGAVPL